MTTDDQAEVAALPRRPCMACWPMRVLIQVWTTPSAELTATTSQTSSVTLRSGSAVSITARNRNGEARRTIVESAAARTAGRAITAIVGVALAAEVVTHVLNIVSLQQASAELERVRALLPLRSPRR